MSAGSPPHGPAFVDVLREWSSTPLRLARSSEPPRPVHMRRAVEEVLRRLGDRTAKPPTPHELEETLRAIRSAWEARASLEGVSVRDLRRAPWVFFYPRTPAERWIARDASFLTAWLRWLDESRNVRAVAALMREFLSAYPEELPIFEELRLGLRKQMKHAKSARLVRWRERSEQFGFLDKGGPARFIGEWRGGALSCEAYLDAAGLSPGLEASAFVEKATERFLKATEKALRQAVPGTAELSRAFEWLERNGKLRFESLRVATATALLGPFADRAPQPSVQEQIRSFLCRTIGDPRMQRPAWQGVPDEIRDVLLRWLVAMSFEDFFRVFDDTAWKEHWTYRKAFWSAYLKKGVISDAWVVLGREARERMRRSVDVDGIGAASFRTGSDAHRSHSALVMRIGGLTVAEWSHNGTCRIWREGDKSAPKLYASKYSRWDLTENPSFPCPHDDSARGYWQAKIARFIAEETGIRVSQGEYMPQKGKQR